MEITIYKLTNLVNNFGYVGRICNFHRRMSEHRRGHNLGGRIDRAIKKYGWENFTTEVLEVCDAEIAPERERYWIALLGTKTPYGYNLTDGGEGVWGFSPTLEQRLKMSRKKRRKKTVYPRLQVEMDRQKITQVALGQMLGINHAIISEWMADKYEPRVSDAIKVKEVFGVDIPIEVLFSKEQQAE